MALQYCRGFRLDIHQIIYTMGNFLTKSWNVAIIIATILLIVLNIAANIIAYRDGIPVWGWIVGDIILVFVDCLWVKGLIQRFGKKE